MSEKKKPVNVQTRLFHNEISSDELQKCIDQQPWANGKQIKIKVLIPQSGEYALQINTSDEDHLASDAYDNVCNYLLTNEKEDTAQQDWKKVCKVLEIKGKQSVQSRVQRFRVKTADTEVCTKARSICEDYFDNENASDDADAQDTFCDWVQKAVVAKETVTELQDYLPPGTDYDDDVFISSDEA
ncbi:hypothetical protein CHS0354_037925 [Potamilus streckersoni]|uniref:KY-like immunoglobulin-like domain-containing protein n=1 Tax=Potamilus streckersoni TaxID=2493646 RepID=A0AAE0TAM4_9BIVA|nr:hypothetical protein CHS0354_037925 [Potamilus streckersoni]